MLLDNNIPLYQIQALFDMEWQVHFSRGKYGSSTGHVLLIGALSKKI
jgi:hypothetical protein